MNVVSTKSNVDSLIGKQGQVVRKILPNRAGAIAIDGEEWRAGASMEIDQEERVTVRGVEGVTLLVEKSNQKE